MQEADLLDMAGCKVEVTEASEKGGSHGSQLKGFAVVHATPAMHYMSLCACNFRGESTAPKDLKLDYGMYCDHF